ncbi:hypothetical protein IJ579_05455 [bacterium]|nr:hypothetical protein [bacterium]
MYQDKIYEEALKEAKEQSFLDLKDEVKTVENLINRFLTQLLECSTTAAERDFNVCSI